MKPRNLFTAALLAGCIGLLQTHSIQFWMASVDPVTGAAWSVLLEGAALWLWSHRLASRRGLGALATVLLLAGPLYQVSAPLIQEWQSVGAGTAARQDRLAQIGAELGPLESSLSAYQAVNTTRQGWAGRIDATANRINQLRDEQATLTREAGQAAPRMAWQRIAIIGLQAVAIVLFQLLAVLAITELRTERERHQTGLRLVKTDRISGAGKTIAAEPSKLVRFLTATLRSAARKVA